jgi:hypothetical protein
MRRIVKVKLDLRYPFLTTGIPKRNKRRRDIYMSISTEVDIPEVFESETEIAFVSHERYRFIESGFRYDRPDNNDYRLNATPQGVTLRSHDGRLYRRIGTPRMVLQDTDRSFKRGAAFPHDIMSKGLEYGANISFAETGGNNPMSVALTRQWDWELERNSVGAGRRVNAWPMSAGGTTREGHRENMDFVRESLEIADVDEVASARSLAMIREQAGRLLAIEGEIWMSCPPLCLVVDPESDPGRKTAVTISVAHAPDGFDSKLQRRYFRLDELGQAREYQKLCARKPISENGQYRLFEAIPEYRVEPRFAEFDAEAEEVARIGYALASECFRHQARTGDWLEGTRQDNLDAAMKEVEATNYVTGELGNMAPYLELLIDTWNGFGRPGTYCDFGPPYARKRFGDLMIRRAEHALDSAPVVIGSEPTFALGNRP